MGDQVEKILRGIKSLTLLELHELIEKMEGIYMAHQSIYDFLQDDPDVTE